MKDLFSGLQLQLFPLNSLSVFHDTFSEERGIKRKRKLVEYDFHEIEEVYDFCQCEGAPVRKQAKLYPEKRRSTLTNTKSNHSWQYFPLDIRQLTLHFCDVRVIMTIFDLFPNIVKNCGNDFFRHLANIQWPGVGDNPESTETGYSIPFQQIYTTFPNDTFLHFTSRSRIQVNFENLLSEKYTQTHIVAIICYVMKIKEDTENEGIEFESKHFQILFQESMRWIVNIFDAIGQPEIRLSLNYYEKKYIDSYIHRSEEILDTHRQSYEVAMCCKALGVLFSDPEIHAKATHSTVNKLLSHLTNYKQRNCCAVSNALWCLYMLSISPKVSVYENISDGVWENLQYLLTIPGEDGGGFWTLLNELFEYYESDPDILAKLFRITANITCLPNRVDERSLNSISRNAIRAMQRYPNSKDLQGKCLALVVNVHEVYDHNIEIFIELGLEAASKFTNDAYLQGKFLYVIENCLTGNAHVHALLAVWPQVDQFLQHARSFSVLAPTVTKCFRLANMHF